MRFEHGEQVVGNAMRTRMPHFEAAKCVGRSGRCLEQVITQNPIPWGPLPDPWSLAGDIGRTD
jgi:hypothetical protein